jgi:hypothetical protein
VSPHFDLEGLDVDDPRFHAAIEMIGRTGAEEFQIRFCEEEEPNLWMCSARWGDHWDTAAALHPVLALFRLCDQMVDGGMCTHCQRPTGFIPDFESPAPSGIATAIDAAICWYRFDPELETFRRSCEGVAP